MYSQVIILARKNARNVDMHMKRKSALAGAKIPRDYCQKQP
jgi:hypothetical protein